MSWENTLTREEEEFLLSIHNKDRSRATFSVPMGTRAYDISQDLKTLGYLYFVRTIKNKPMSIDPFTLYAVYALTSKGMDEIERVLYARAKTERVFVQPLPRNKGDREKKQDRTNKQAKTELAELEAEYRKVMNHDA